MSALFYFSVVCFLLGAVAVAAVLLKKAKDELTHHSGDPFAAFLLTLCGAMVLVVTAWCFCNVFIWF